MPYPNTLQSTVNQNRVPESSTNQNRRLRQVVNKRPTKALEKCHSMKKLSENSI